MGGVGVGVGDRVSGVCVHGSHLFQGSRDRGSSWFSDSDSDSDYDDDTTYGQDKVA